MVFVTPMPCPSTGSKIFCASTNFLIQPKHFIDLVPLQKLCAGTKPKVTVWKSSFGVAQTWDCRKMYINLWSGTKNLD